MAHREALEGLATLCGVDLWYHDIRGVVQEASVEALEGVLSAVLREPVTAENAGLLAKAYRERALARLSPPVNVLWGGQGVLSLSLPRGARAVRVSVTLADGTTREDERPAERLAPARRDGEGHVHYPLPFALPTGYHRVRVEAGLASVEAALWSAPRTCFAGDDRPSWGAFAPTYALRSERNQGVGDLADLARLSRWVGERGGRVVSTLPLLPAFLDDPYDPSPYAPVSRLFWNELFLAIDQLPELSLSAPARELMQSDAFRATAADLRALPLVDYRGVMVHLRRLFALLAEAAFEHPATRAELEAALERRPELGDYARFRATRERQGRPFRQWSAAAREGTLGPRDYDPSGFAYHLYVQARMASQLEALSRAARESSVGLYLDLSLGAHPEGYDAWRHRDALLEGCAAGAPPDTLFEGGQNWGFSALHPIRSAEAEHRYFRASLAHAMRHADVLRIDHVMGLHRVFCIPRGLPATAGVYVRQPHDALYAALSIESHLHRTHVVGEDLGTVPDEVREAMEVHGLGRLHVVQYDVPTAGASCPVNSVASLNTHDMPTYAGLLQGRDIDDRVALGLADEARAAGERREREGLRRRKRDALQARGLWFEDEGDDAALLHGELAALAQSEARRVLINLEDLWLEALPQNVPGTGAERPNWRHKLALTLGEIERDPEVARRLAPFEGRVEEGSRVPTRSEAVEHASRLSDLDLHLFNEGTHGALWKKLGAHVGQHEGAAGCHFAVWAPNAERVGVMGDFNDWRAEASLLAPRGRSGIWEGFVSGVGPGALYKFSVHTRAGEVMEKADPFARHAEVAPRTASIVYQDDYAWGDAEWMATRGARQRRDAPTAIYEVHLGSFLRGPRGEFRSIREVAPELVSHVRAMGFTHVEFLPVMEHPFYGSWGYQSTGYFAPSSRYGRPEDLKALVDALHQAGIGVLFDWVPGHFPDDPHGLARFDGTCLFEHEDPRRGFHPEWKSLIFNYGRAEVRSFLVSSALYWVEEFHADGLRVDGVASMLYLDYAREAGQWIPNALGGRENLEAVALLRQLNEAVYAREPDVQTTAEDSTSWPMVSRPTDRGGLGFGYKWDLGWMHDTLQHFGRDPIHRKYHQDELTFRSVYAGAENYVLPLSHDEVVHGKGSLLRKMPGDDWQRFANLRTLYALMYATPGHKLLFMGSELAPWTEWDHDTGLDWSLQEHPAHAGVRDLVIELNRTYRREPALHAWDMEARGFAWVDTQNVEQSVLIFERRGPRARPVVVVLNLTPVPREGYDVGVVEGGFWEELLNTDAVALGGSGWGNLGGVESESRESHGRPHTLRLCLPPLSALYLAPTRPLPRATTPSP